jgi:NitT/TauT family transport system ATP-binding protein
VAIAMALTLNPKRLLIDEQPLAAHDVQTRRLLYYQVLYMRQETNKTVFSSPIILMRQYLRR